MRKKTNGLFAKKCLLILGITSAVSILGAGCGKEEESQQSVDIQEEVTVEESTEVQEPVAEEETDVEDSTEESIVEMEQAEELSDEEWFKSLNLTDARFMIFNDTTGERKLLENGQEYTLLEGDVLASWYPLENWKFIGLEPSYLYNDVEAKFECVFIYLNHDQISENSELTLHVKDSDGNDVYANVFLSK